MSRRKSQNEHPEPKTPTKRVTRSATSQAATPLANVDTNGLSPLKRSSRLARAGNEDADGVTPVKRSKRRRSEQIHTTPSRGVEDDERTEYDEADAEDLQEAIDASTGSRKRVVFESVEIATPRKSTKLNAQPRETSPTPNTRPRKTTTKAYSSQQKKLSRTTVKTFRDHINDDTPETDYISDAEELPLPLPSKLHTCLAIQKRSALSALREQVCGHLLCDTGEHFVNVKTASQLQDLLGGTINRGEGNSCLIIGPSGSGKTSLTESVLENFTEQRPVIVRLNGLVQFTDRLAIREIARQIVEQTNSNKFRALEAEDDANPFVDQEDDVPVGFLPPPAHLPSLVAALPTLGRPVVVLLDAFDRFANQPRQGLLYCLLDTVQSCRVGCKGQHGLAVVGLTARVDVINTLEKRVKSRFSHRIFRTAGLPAVERWVSFLKDSLLHFSSETRDNEEFTEWRQIWEQSVLSTLESREVRGFLDEILDLSRDIRYLLRIMTHAILQLHPSAPYLSVSLLRSALEVQQSKSQLTQILDLDYPSLSLLIAAHHAQIAGQDAFSFEFLYDLFSTQVRASSAAPVMLGGGSIGMINVGKYVLLAAFNSLIRKRIFTQAMNSNSTISPEFIKYRCTAERLSIKTAVDKAGQTTLKKWFNKAQ